jgi:CRP-like cAMP-binding protein
MSADDLKAFAAFADLSEGERAEVADLLEERELAPGETLFVEGDEADALVLVREGSLRVSSRRTHDAATLGSGSVVGGLALFTVGARAVTAEGAERADVLLLRREDFLRFSEDSPRAALRVATALFGDLAAQAHAVVETLAPASVDRAPRGE